MPNLIDSINVKGDVTFTIYDQEGNIKQIINDNNMVLTNGKYFIASKIAGSSASIAKMAIGSGKNSPSLSDTSLQTQIDVSKNIDTITSLNNIVTVTASFSGSTYASPSISEAGLFSSDVSNNLICRTTFGAFPILSTDVIGISWKLTIV